MTEGVVYRGGGQWPSFELVAYRDPEWIAGTFAAGLLRAGVPRSLIGLSYSASEELEVLESASQERLICFGRSGLSEKICVNPKTGVVLQIDPGHTSERFVNSSLETFTQSVRAIIDRFPFYGSDSELDECEEVASELSEIISVIDPQGLVADGFWETFVGDVSIGDYVTEEIVDDVDK